MTVRTFLRWTAIASIAEALLVLVLGSAYWQWMLGGLIRFVEAVQHQ